MKNYTHITASILFFLVFAYLFNIKNDELPAGILIASITSVMPDLIDIITKSKHRGIGHSLLLWIPLTVLTGVISILKGNITILTAISVAVVSHIILDLVTVTGYPLLYPKKTAFFALNYKKRIKTGHRREKAVFIFLVLLLIPAFIFSFSLLPLTTPTAAQETTTNTLNNQSAIKDSINVNIDNKMNNTNITVKKVNENETEILVQDIKT